jgi:pimeloyl-ACP methyl ester carboxylesterase
MRRLSRSLLFLSVLPLAAIVCQQLCARRDRRRFLSRGLLLETDGLPMYLSQKGSNEPTVVFESGIAATSQNWTHLQNEVSRFARTITYDRCGLGWSSASPAPRTPSNIVRELRALLHKAEIKPPYLLVGHSFGALVVRRFASEHPHEVAGVILIDAMRPEEWPPASEAQRSAIDRGLRLSRIALPLAHLGVARLILSSLLLSSGRISRTIGRAGGADGRLALERISGEVGKMPREVWPVVVAHWSNPGFYRGLAAHLHAIPDSVREMHTANPITHIPVFILIAADAQPLAPGALRRIAPEARQIIAQNSGHWIHLDEPALVLNAIRSMIDQLNSDSSAIQKPAIKK